MQKVIAPGLAGDNTDKQLVEVKAAASDREGTAGQSAEGLSALTR